MRLTKDQQLAKSTLAALLRDTEEADVRYDSLPVSHGGRIVSTDIARFLDVRYRDVPLGRPRDPVPGWDLAWRYAQDRLVRELKQRGRRKVVRFMAGGWGAGKTHALEHEPVPDLAWDGTLRDPEWADQMICLAIGNGWKVDVAYIFRDIELALYGAVERSRKEGRSVPLRELPSVHRAVQISILSLIARFRENNDVSFTLLHNTGSEHVRGQALVFLDPELDEPGALHYSPRHESYYTEIAGKIEAHNPA